MEAILGGLHAVVWFWYQAVTVGGLGIVYFIVPFVILVTFLVVGFPRRETGARRRLWGLIVGLPAIWLFTGFWGGVFWLDVSIRPLGSNAPWVEYPADAAPLLSLGVAGFFVWWLRGARLFALSYSVINIYFAIAMSFLSGMAVTGVWL
jgi:hypothetical protein